MHTCIYTYTHTCKHAFIHTHMKHILTICDRHTNPNHCIIYTWYILMLLNCRDASDYQFNFIFRSRVLFSRLTSALRHSSVSPDRAPPPG